jgi:hypothetical protein
MRVTKLDACGVPVLGPASQVVSKGVIQLQFTANLDEGTEISVQNFNGDTCIEDQPTPKFKNYTLQADLCGVDPDVIRIMTGQAPMQDYATTPNNIGFKMNSNTDLSATGFALEVWTGTAGAACGDTGLPDYGYILVPFVKGGVVGDFTVANDAINFSITNATSKDGTGWGVGPYDVMLDDGGVASPLPAELDSFDHLLVFKTQVPPPTDACGAGQVGTPATGATAGTPGTYTPANSYGAADLAGMSGITASPATAWTTGQYVTLQDGSKVHWNGTAWVAGAA